MNLLLPSSSVCVCDKRHFALHVNVMHINSLFWGWSLGYFVAGQVECVYSIVPCVQIKAGILSLVQLTTLSL